MLAPLLSGGRSVEMVLAILRPIFQAVPSILKWSAALLFLVNIRSWPLVWHFKIWRPIWRYQFRFLLFRMSLALKKSKREKELALDKWFASLSPVGKNPFDMVSKYRTWAGPDDCDFNMHLSNSCYAKHLDMARFNAALTFMPTGFIAGAWMGVGATHFKYLKEIPIFSTYEMRTSIASWDNKWMYVLTRYVTHSHKQKGKRSPASTPGQSTPPVGAPLMPPTHTPATTHDTPSCLTPYDTALHDLIASLSARSEPDGATLHCVVITEVCFKVGRITVPPAVALASDGYCVRPPASEDRERYSLANPPPHMDKIRALKARGDFKPMQAFYRGGWRDVPEGERWWMSALGGEIEERRRLNLDLVCGVQRGMEGARYV